MIPQKN